MRPYLVLIAVALLTAFGAGTLALDLARGADTEGTAADIPRIKAGFEAQHAAQKTELDLAALFPAQEATRLVDPRETLPQTARHDATQIAALARYAETCAGAEAVTGPALAKALTWHRAQCGQGTLPPTFFESPPFLHPAGASFAALSNPTHAWALAHARLFHITEWKNDAPADRALLASLSRDALTAIANGDALILDPKHVLFARIGPVENARRYSVYPRKDWDAAIARGPLLATTQTGACLATEGAVCWVRNDVPYLARLSRLTAALLALAIASTAAAGFLLVRRVRTQREEEARQRFVLQTLTHELRTPVANLLLSVESLRRDFDLLPPQAQTDVLAVVNDAHRLRRLAEQSKAYLGTARVKLQKIDDLAAFVAQTLEAHAGVTVVAPHTAVHADPFWLAMCLTNLVENAAKHGAAPIRVTVTAVPLRVEVTDAGTLTSASKNAGLGLGLSIVRRAVEAMGGTLEVGEHPTRFSFTLPGAP